MSIHPPNFHAMDCEELLRHAAKLGMPRKEATQHSCGTLAELCYTCWYAQQKVTA